MKRYWFLVLSFFIFATGFSCRSIAVLENDKKAETLMTQQNGIKDFLEVRRVNRNVLLKEASVIRSFSETSELYSKLNDKKFSRSEPIPTLFDDEYFLILKPKLKNVQYGDIEVQKIEEDNLGLKVYYKEVDNNEYSLEKQNNPIVILRLKGKAPAGIKLLLQ